MPTLIRYVVLTLVFCTTVTSLSSFHIIGGEITYECLGEGSVPDTRLYQFTMYVYRDCQGGGAELDPIALIGVWAGNQTPYDFVGRVSPILNGPRPVDPPEIECLIPPEDVCVEEGSYMWTVELPIISQAYHFSYQRCCRNSSITNIVNPDRIGATYASSISPMAQAECNNSPQFRSFPPTVICVNEPLTFDHGAIDADGDSLTYEFCSPLLGGGLGGSNGMGDPRACDGVQPDPGCAPPYNAVSFRFPVYSFNAPMAGSPLVSIDSQTGVITGTPNTIGQYVVGVCVREYRNGELIGTLNRDFQFNVEDCESTVVAQIQADETVGEKDFLLTVCGEQTVDFVNESFQESQINTYLWQFDLQENNIVEFTTRDVTVTFPDTGTYSGRLFLNKNSICEDSADISVRILPKIVADFEFSYDTCEVGPVTFENLSFTEADRITNNLWNLGNDATTTSVSPIFTFPDPGAKQVTLEVTDNNNCIDQITKTVLWVPAPQTVIVQPNTFLGCEPAEITFTNLSFPIDETYTFNWTFGDGQTGDALSPVHIYENSGVYDVSLEIISPIGCQVSETFNSLIRVEPGPTADFDFTPKELSSFNNTAQFVNLSSGEINWFWDFDREGFSTEENPIYTFPDTGLQEVRLIVTKENGCQDTITKFIDVVPEVIFHMPNAFTPNNDGNNEEFFGKGILDGMREFEFSIWNRWGEQVFYTNDPTEGWNGQKMNQGETSPVGAYMYLVTYNGPRGEPYKLKGSVNLVR